MQEEEHERQRARTAEIAARVQATRARVHRWQMLERRHGEHLAERQAALRREVARRRSVLLSRAERRAKITFEQVERQYGKEEKRMAKGTGVRRKSR